MRTKSILCVAYLLVGFACIAPQTHLLEPKPPKDLIEQLWKRARLGELLTPEGWRHLATIYAQPNLHPGNDVVLVYSDDYAVNLVSIDADTAVVDVDYADMGRINPSLSYAPPPVTIAHKTSFRYRLSLVPSQIVTYGADGKTVLKVEENPRIKMWRIDGSQLEFPPGAGSAKPWTTVNGAIRYVLEMREKAIEPAIKKNADDTLARLLKLH